MPAKRTAAAESRRLIVNIDAVLDVACRPAAKGRDSASEGSFSLALARTCRTGCRIDVLLAEQLANRAELLQKQS